MDNYQTLPPYQPDTVVQAKAAERRSLKRTATALCFTFSCVFVAYQIILIAIEVSSLILHSGVSVNAVLSDEWTGLLFQALFSVLLFLVPFLVMMPFVNLKPREAFRFNFKDKRLIFSLVFIGLGALSVINTLSVFYSIFFDSIGIPTSGAEMAVPDGALGFTAYFAVSAILPAVVEEFAMRGVLLSALRRYGDAAAIICSSLVFGCMHGNLRQIPFAFLAGVVFAYVDVMTDSIWPSVMIHFLNNALAVVVNCLIEVNTGIGVAVYVASEALVICAGLLCALYIARRYDYAFAPLKNKSCLSVKEGVGAFCGSLGGISVFVVFGLEALLYVFTKLR